MYTLIGLVDNIEIKFVYYPPNTFKAIIPKKMDGIYIVELHCFDEAGNETFFMDRLVQIDFRNMKMTQLPLNYKSLIGRYEYEDKQLNALYGYRELPLKYSAKEVKVWH